MEKKQICLEVAKALKLKAEQVNENSSSSDMDNWDSLGHISLIMHLDKKYNDLTKDKPEYMTATSIDDLYEAGLKDVEYKS